MKKRGISPIIGVVLAVVLLLSLSFVVMRFSQKNTKSILSETEISESAKDFCEDIDFSLVDAYCDEELIYITINNKQNTDFKDSFTLTVDTVDGQKEITAFLVNTELRAYEEKELKALRLIEDGNLVLFNKLSVVPKVEIEEKVVYCDRLIKNYDLEGRDCNG